MAYSQPTYPGGPMLYPQIGYPQGAYLQAYPLQVPMAAIQGHGQDMPSAGDARLPAASLATLPQHMMIPPIVPGLQYGVFPGPGLAPQAVAAEQQVPQDEPEPDLEEAKMTMLAQYYKNPYYGLKAQLARAKADKKAAAQKAVDDQKSFARYRQYLRDATMDYQRDKKALAKRERYWRRTAYQEGIDEKVIASEQQAMATRKRQLIDTKEYLVQQKRGLRDQMQIAGLSLSGSESELSGPSSFADSQSSESPGGRGRKNRRRKGKRSKEKQFENFTKKTDNVSRARSRSHSRPAKLRESVSPPLFPMARAKPEVSGTQPAGRIYHAASHPVGHIGPLPVTGLQRSDSHNIGVVAQQRPALQRPVAVQTVLKEVNLPPAPSPHASKPNQADASLRVVSRLTGPSHFPSERNKPAAMDTAQVAENKGSNQSAIIQLVFPGKVIFPLTQQQIARDAPNAFLQVIEDFKRKIKPGKTLKVPILDRNPDAFRIIEAYLAGHDILPLSRHASRMLTGEAVVSVKALDALMREAQFYQLAALQAAIRANLQLEALASRESQPSQRPQPEFEEIFTLIDLNRKGQAIGVRDLQHLVASRLSRRRLLKTLPSVRCIVHGAALNFGTKTRDMSDGQEEIALQYSIAIPATTLSLAWQQILTGGIQTDGPFFIEDEMSSTQANKVVLKLEYAQNDAVTIRSTTLSDILAVLGAGQGDSVDNVFLDTFRLLRLGGPPDAPNRSNTPPFGVKDPPPRNQKQFANLPIASLVLDFMAYKDEYKPTIKSIKTKTRQLEHADGYNDIASPASR